MRELVKSCAGFSLAMSLFGLELLRNLLSEKDSEDKEKDSEESEEGSASRRYTVKEDLDSVTEATEEHFGERAQRLFESGDRLQREVIDLVFDMFKYENWKPKKVVDRVADFAEESAKSLRETMEETKKPDDADEGGERAEQAATPSGKSN